MVKKNILHKHRSRLVEFTLLQMLQHNVQLGAATRFSLLSSHWFIFGARQRFAIINLSQTVLHFRYFLDLIKYSIAGRRHILLVNERRFATMAVADVAESVGEAYVMGRWVGGSITNFRKLWLMYHRVLKKKDSQSLSRFQVNLKSSLQGLAVLKSLPSVIFFNSVKSSYWATGEAYALHIPSAGITDTDAIPNSVLYPIPGNDDAFGSVYFLNKLVAKLILITKIEAMVKLYSTFCNNLMQWSLRADRAKTKKNSRRQTYKPSKRFGRGQRLS